MTGREGQGFKDRADHIRHLEALIARQRNELRYLHAIVAGRKTYWQRRAEAAEAVLREFGDSNLSEYDLQPLTAYYRRRYRELRDEMVERYRSEATK